MSQLSIDPSKSPMPQITPVLLCGGSGTRLWPLSRKSFPKQFSSILGGESLFQASVNRLTGADFAAPLIISGSDAGGGRIVR